MRIKKIRNTWGKSIKLAFCKIRPWNRCATEFLKKLICFDWWILVVISCAIIIIKWRENLSNHKKSTFSKILSHNDFMVLSYRKQPFSNIAREEELQLGSSLNVENDWIALDFCHRRWIRTWFPASTGKVKLKLGKVQDSKKIVKIHVYIFDLTSTRWSLTKAVVKSLPTGQQKEEVFLGDSVSLFHCFLMCSKFIGNEEVCGMVSFENGGECWALALGTKYVKVKLELLIIYFS